jgi:hypothetical protein
MLAGTLDLTMSYAERLEALRVAKSAQTIEKQIVRGSMDYDDHGTGDAILRRTVQVDQRSHAAGCQDRDLTLHEPAAREIK